MALSQEDIQKYKTLFLQTARSYLQSMQAHISLLLKGNQKQESISQIHRDAHSLKSQCQIMGYKNLGELSEIFENIFDKHEKEKTDAARDVLIKLQSEIARMLDSLDEIEKNNKELDLSDRVQGLSQYKG